MNTSQCAYSGVGIEGLPYLQYHEGPSCYSCDTVAMPAKQTLGPQILRADQAMLNHAVQRALGNISNSYQDLIALIMS